MPKPASAVRPILNPAQRQKMNGPARRPLLRDRDRFRPPSDQSGRGEFQQGFLGAMGGTVAGALVYLAHKWLLACLGDHSPSRFSPTA